MVTLVRGGEIFSPDPLGEKDILILGHTIGAVCEPGQIKVEGIPIADVDASGKRICPGFIDSHVHILGGGGGKEAPPLEHRRSHWKTSSRAE